MDQNLEGNRNFTSYGRGRAQGRPVSGLTAKHRQNYYSSMPSLAPDDERSSVPYPPGQCMNIPPDCFPQGINPGEQTQFSGDHKQFRSRPITPNRYRYNPPQGLKLNSAFTVHGEIPWSNSGGPFPSVIPRNSGGRRPLTQPLQQFEYEDGENLNYEQIQTSNAPLTFSQAQDALNHMVPIGFPVSNGRNFPGVKSADSISDFNYQYDIDDESMVGDEDTGEYEEDVQAQIDHQNALLHVIQMEKMLLDGRMRHVLRQRQELQDRMNLFRHDLHQPVRSKNQRYSHQPNKTFSGDLSYIRTPHQYILHGANDRMGPSGNTFDQGPGWVSSDSAYCHRAARRGNESVSKSPKWISSKQPPQVIRRYSQSPHRYGHISIEYTDGRENLMQPKSIDSSASEGSDCGRMKEEYVQRYSYPNQTGRTHETVHKEIFLKHRHSMHPPNSASESRKESESIFLAGNGPSPSFVGSMCVPVNHSTQRHKSPKARYSSASLSTDVTPMSSNIFPNNESQMSPTQYWQAHPPKSAPSFPETFVTIQGAPECAQVRRRNLDPHTRQIRMINPKKQVHPDLYEPGQMNVLEHCIPLKETAESMKYYRKQINILNKENANTPQKQLPDENTVTRTTSGGDDSPLTPEPVDQEIAEICARDNAQPRNPSQRSNLPNGVRMLNTLDPLPVHVEEDTDVEFDMTPVQGTQSPCAGSQSSVVIDNRTPTNNIVFATNVDELKSMKAGIDAKMHKVVPAVVPTSKSYSQVRIMRDSVDNILPAGESLCETPEINDTCQRAKGNTQNLVEGIISPVHSMPTFREPKARNNIASANLQYANPRRETLRVEKDVLGTHGSVDIMCLGPIDGFQLEPKSPSTSSLRKAEDDDTPISPIWIAICSGDSCVSVFDLKTHRRLLMCQEHEQYSKAPVAAILPLVATTNITKSSPDSPKKSSQLAASGLLCVVQTDGQITLYNIASRRVSGRLSTNQDIAHVMLLPHTKILHNCLAQNILLISRNGGVSCCQWNFANYKTDQTNVRHPHWNGELHDLGANVYHHLTEEKRILSYICCVCPNQMGQFNNTLTFEPGKSPNGTASSERLQPTNFCLIAAALLGHDEPHAINLRICSWEPRGQKLASCDKVTKTLNLDSTSELVGITYAEIAGASSICICLTTQVYWFSLKSLDMVSTLKLPSCTQPANLLAPVWPHFISAGTAHSLQNERLWTAASTGRILQISAFESQRKRDAQGRHCLVMLYAVPSDAKITTVTSAITDKELVLVGTDKGEIHVIHFPKNYYICKMPNCPIGLPTPEDLLHHIVCDHYLAKPNCFDRMGLHCEWPDCEFTIDMSDRPKTAEKLESHARGHIDQL